jgi:hypothetical protein
MGDIGEVANATGKIIDEDMLIEKREQQQEDALDEAAKQLRKPLPNPLPEKGK